jgi:predicted kinase
MEAVIFIGIQAAGKSSFYKARFFKTHLRINLDMLKTRHREQIFLRACLEAKMPFVVDNTNPTIEKRAGYIQLAKANRFRVVGYYFQSSAQESRLRNNTRPAAERVPDQAIYGTYKRLQLPSLEEGFDALYYVKLNGADDFLVEPWTPEP